MKAVREMSQGELAAFVCSHLEGKGVSVVLSGGGCVSLYAVDRYVYSMQSIATSQWTSTLSNACLQAGGS